MSSPSPSSSLLQVPLVPERSGTGTFLGVHAPEHPHRCIKPPVFSAYPTYLVWRCDCGEAFRLEHDQHHDAFRDWIRYPVGDRRPGSGSTSTLTPESTSSG